MGYIYWKPCFWWAHENLSTHWQEMRLWLCVAWGNNVCNSKWTILIVFFKTKICNWQWGCKHGSQNRTRFENVQRLKHEGITTVASDDFKRPVKETCQWVGTLALRNRSGGGSFSRGWGSLFPPPPGYSGSGNRNCSIFVDKLCIFLWTLESVNGGQSLFVV